jgi:transcriptional regulator of acetoin/glycerol metabolism
VVGNPWLAHIPSDRAEQLRLEKVKAEVDSIPVAPGIRRLVRESWLRSVEHKVNPSVQEGRAAFTGDDLRDYRNQHILAPLVPIVHRLLLKHTFDQGLIVAIGDESGRLLWVEGDRAARMAADRMGFSEGADWSESAMGTSAPGTALVLNHGIQIHGAEHYAEVVEPWSCTAVPIHHPEDNRVIGVIDITGGPDAIHPAALPLLEATAAAMQAELQSRRLDAIVGKRASRGALPRAMSETKLRVLGRDQAVVERAGSDTIVLSARHSEILALLVWHRQGLSAQALADALYGGDGSVVSVRAEMTRLKKIVDSKDLGFTLESRPYRVLGGLESDVERLLGFVDRGAHRVALAKYVGRVLPSSGAPGVEEVRAIVTARIREAMLEDASLEVLLAYARTEDAVDDVEVWRACLQLLAPGSPKRSGVVVRLEALEVLRN